MFAGAILKHAVPIVADADNQGGQSGRVTSLLMFGEQKHGSKLI